MNNLLLTELTLPSRDLKPRSKGLTLLIDNGISLNQFKDTITSHGHLVDFVKFGWGTSLVSVDLQKKMECLLEANIHYFFGGTLFEKFLSQNKVEQFYQYCKSYYCNYVEISNGTIDITNTEKASFIKDFSKDFLVLSEVGSKDVDKSETLCTSEWIEYIYEDFEAGSTKVITEARESGTSGICQRNGEIRDDIVEQIVSSDLDLNNMIFEAPTKKMQTHFIKKVGPNVNVGNIPFTDIISLETLRLGLRSDTFYLAEQEEKI
ncbi:phosphosulfolactate synthase [Halalkalibacter suaedae]|uniref:Phosphosulfolactate synthase n=1 Tax=Halalkalibacter suaedae TaxID=2822140 RepID=A0A941APU2_9BACI|nr:phosphosulfolactate synthase [Bacillus suaedae]MBP3950473.1 phosphosulfolactate synthase [Bacillus suaedae]